MDFDNFDLDPELEKNLESKHNHFIESQEEVEASNECEGGACVI